MNLTFVKTNFPPSGHHLEKETFMSQLVDNHPLAQDLPEYRDAIHNMKMNNAHFSRLMEEYEALDKQIVRAEQGVEYIPDLELDGLKMQRVKLKDDLVSQLQQS
jgi:uncharacterized protein YdcH (DUF465 family)